MKPIVLAVAMLLAGCAAPHAPQQFHFDDSLSCTAEEPVARLDDGLAALRAAAITCVA
jgi:tagatose-1,6-bisphosphate aldolase non-catalytic subunit AgaZ/GatZ